MPQFSDSYQVETTLITSGFIRCIWSHVPRFPDEDLFPPVRTWPTPDSTSVDVSSVSPDHRCFLWRASNEHGHWSRDQSTSAWQWITDARAGPEWNAAILLLSSKVTNAFVRRAIRQLKLLTATTTLPQYLRHWGACALGAVSLMVPWALCGTQDPHAFAQSCHSVRKMYRSLHEGHPLRYSHVFHQTRFISRGLWNMCSEIHGVTFRVKGHEKSL